MDMRADILRLVSDWGLAMLLPMTIAEGPVATVVAGWLVKLQVLPLLPTFLIVVAGDVIGDLMYYALGHQGLRRLPQHWRHRLGLNPARVAALTGRFAENGVAFLIAAKLTHGAGAAVLTAAGAAGMRLGPFLIANLGAGAVKAVALLALGYVLGQEAVAGWLLPLALLAAVAVLLVGCRRRQAT